MSQPQEPKQSHSTLFNITVPGGFQNSQPEVDDAILEKEEVLVDASFEVVLGAKNPVIKANITTNANKDSEHEAGNTSTA